VVLAQDDTGRLTTHAAACEICQASKHGSTTEVAGRQHFHTGLRWQIVAIVLVCLMFTSEMGNNGVATLQSKVDCEVLK